jgi:hypothetical protein
MRFREVRALVTLREEPGERPNKKIVRFEQFVAVVTAFLEEYERRRKLLGEDPACQCIECQGQLASMLRTLPGISDF